MRCLRLTVAYDGTDFFGWQWQPAQRTVQGTLEGAIARITDQASRAVGSSRTDRGVHALGQTVSLTISTRLDAATLKRALNAHLPSDLAVLAVAEAPLGFHAINDAIAKRYRYVIDDGPVPDLFSRRYAWYVPQSLDAQQMHNAARALVGKHDCKSYESAGSRRLHTVRTIHSLAVQRCPFQGGERVVIEVEADGFLYNMARNIVGTLVEVGRRRRSVEWPAEVLAAGDRRLAGMTAPPHGLYLLRVLLDSYY